MAECLWNLYRFGYKVLNAKRVECVIDLLCARQNFAAVSRILRHHEHLPYLLKPRNFTFILRERLLQGKQLSKLLDDMDEAMRWPSCIAASMLYGPLASKQNTTVLELLEKDGNDLATNQSFLVDGCMYYLMQKNDVQRMQEHLVFCTTHEPAPIRLSPRAYAFSLLTLFRNKKIPETASLLSYMREQNVTLTELADAAKENLSKNTFHELYEEVNQRAGFDLYDHLSKPKETTDSPNVLDYIV